jgi:hypothetical protein
MLAKGNEASIQNFCWKASREKTTCEMWNSYNDVNVYVISGKVSYSVLNKDGPEIIMSEMQLNAQGISYKKLPLQSMTCIKKFICEK